MWVFNSGKSCSKRARLAPIRDMEHVLRFDFVDFIGVLKDNLLDGELLHGGETFMIGLSNHYFNFVWEGHFLEPLLETVKGVELSPLICAWESDIIL